MPLFVKALGTFSLSTERNLQPLHSLEGWASASCSCCLKQAKVTGGLGVLTLFKTFYLFCAAMVESSKKFLQANFKGKKK